MSWSAVQGQPLALRVLKTHLERQCVPPAYLFAGPQGVGKRLAAIELAKALNCEAPKDGACGECRQCGRFGRAVHPDLHVIEPQGATHLIRIDEIRQLLGRVMLRPYMARYQVAILEGADRLTEEAANSLLKTLEEPPAFTRFVLLTDQPSHCLPTIVSRCQRVRFQRLADEVLAALLVRHELCDAATAPAVARVSQGSLALAARMAKEWDEFRERCDRLSAAAPGPWLEWSSPTERKELAPWVAHSLLWLRDVALAGIGCEALVHHPESVAAIRAQAGRMDRDRCLATAQRLAQWHESLEHMANPRLVGTMLREAWVSLLGTPEPAAPSGRPR